MKIDAAEFLSRLFRPPETGEASGGRAEAGAVRPAEAGGLPPEWHFAWDERAAILEYDAGLPREVAEARALEDVRERMRRAGAGPGDHTCL